MSQIAIDEHVFIAGITGGGKSVLARKYLSQFPFVIKLDTKGEALRDIRLNKNPWIEVSKEKLIIVQKLEDLIKVNFKNKPYIIYCPIFEELEQPYFNEFFKWVYFNLEGTNVVVWVDELMEISENSQSVPKYLKALYTKGRSRGSIIWGLTQRPVGIHPICLSQSTHLFCFDLPLDSDRKRVSDSTGAKEFLELPTGYYFWYFKRGWREAKKGIITL